MNQLLVRRITWPDLSPPKVVEDEEKLVEGILAQIKNGELYSD